MFNRIKEHEKKTFNVNMYKKQYIFFLFEKAIRHYYETDIIYFEITKYMEGLKI